MTGIRPCLHWIGPPKNYKENFSSSNAVKTTSSLERLLSKFSLTVKDILDNEDLFVEILDSKNIKVLGSPVKSWIDEDHPTIIIVIVTLVNTRKKTL